MKYRYIKIMISYVRIFTNEDDVMCNLNPNQVPVQVLLSRAGRGTVVFLSRQTKQQG